MTFFGRRPEGDDDPDANPPPAEGGSPPPPPEGDAESQPAERQTANRTFDTALGAGSLMEGTLSSDGNVRLDGQFKGALDIGENVLIGVTAEIEADVTAKNISIAGKVTGNVTGTKIHLLSTAQVWGDIYAQALITEDGAFIEGHIHMQKSRQGERRPAIAPGTAPAITEGQSRQEPSS